MQSPDFYVILSFFLLAVLALFGAYGVIGYRMYLKQNAKQLNDIVKGYQASHDEAVKTMNRLLEYVKKYEKKHNL